MGARRGQGKLVGAHGKGPEWIQPACSRHNTARRAWGQSRPAQSWLNAGESRRGHGALASPGDDGGKERRGGGGNRHAEALKPAANAWPSMTSHLARGILGKPPRHDLRLAPHRAAPRRPMRPDSPAHLPCPWPIAHTCSFGTGSDGSSISRRYRPAHPEAAVAGLGRRLNLACHSSCCRILTLLYRPPTRPARPPLPSPSLAATRSVEHRVRPQCLSSALAPVGTGTTLCLLWNRPISSSCTSSSCSPPPAAILSSFSSS